jgi:cytochrome c553
MRHSSGFSRRIRPELLCVAVLVATAAMAAIPGCRGEGGPPPAADPRSAAAAEALFRDWACGICHGDDRLGTEMAPPLIGLAEHWTVASLAEYLLDPQAVQERDPRLKAMQREYPGMIMPSYDHPEDERRALATWLLQ